MTDQQAPERLTALCCECGTVRTVSARYNGPAKRYAPWETDAEWVRSRLFDLQASGIYTEHQPGWRCLLDLKCSTCNVRTAHAYIREDQHRDHAEEQDRRVDRDRRRVGRRLAGFESAGFTVRQVQHDELKVAGAPVEVVQYADARGVEVRGSLDTPPLELLDCLERLEDYVDDLDLLGEWRDQGNWRGVALRGLTRHLPRSAA